MQHSGKCKAMERIQRPAGAVDWRAGECWVGRAQRIFRTEKMLYMMLWWGIRVIIHSSKLIEWTATRVNPNVIYRFLIIMSQCRLISCNMYTTSVEDVDNEDGYACVTEKAMATHSSNLAWKIPWTEEPGGLQSMGLQRVGHNWTTSLSLFMHWRRKWQPTPVLLPGESQGLGSLVGCRLWGRTELDTTEVT